MRVLTQYLIRSTPVVAAGFPSVAFAQDTTLFKLLYDVLRVIEYLVAIVIGLALVFFLWGLAKFILKAGDEAERQRGKQVMVWGLITLFVMVSVWGIVGFFQSATGLGGGSYFSPVDFLFPGHDSGFEPMDLGPPPTSA